MIVAVFLCGMMFSILAMAAGMWWTLRGLPPDELLEDCPHCGGSGLSSGASAAESGPQEVPSPEVSK